jgi:hypothetical protein
LTDALQGALRAALIAAAGVILSIPVFARDARASQVIVVRRGWHVDVGFAATDLDPPLLTIARDLPGARYLFFGFGDMRYLLAKHHGSSSLAAALWPGRGIMLVTGLTATPQQGFGTEQVVELNLSTEDADLLQRWIWQSFASEKAGVSVYRPGPYEGSLYYLATPRYSAFHTCNTWVAEALQSGHFKVHVKGVLLAGQLWSQVKRLERENRPAPSLAPNSN